jgi:hypothetical protein
MSLMQDGCTTKMGKNATGGVIAHLKSSSPENSVSLSSTRTTRSEGDL